MDTINDLAKRAYEAYSKTTHNKNFMGNEMPKFEELPKTIQYAWENSCKETVEILITPLFTEMLSMLDSARAKQESYKDFDSLCEANIEASACIEVLEHLLNFKKDLPTE